VSALRRRAVLTPLRVEDAGRAEPVQGIAVPRLWKHLLLADGVVELERLSLAYRWHPGPCPRISREDSEEPTRASRHAHALERILNGPGMQFVHGSFSQRDAQ
jgi:hypothetical protein